MKSAIRSPTLKIWPLVRFWLIKRPLRPLAVQDPSAFIARFGKPVRPPPSAKTTEASAREAVGKIVSGSPTDQPPAPKRRKRARGRLSQKLWPSPGKLFREARRATSARTTERVRATARVCHGCRGSFGRRPESCCGKQRASSQRQNYGSEREQRAPPRLDKTATAAGRP